MQRLTASAVKVSAAEPVLRFAGFAVAGNSGRLLKSTQNQSAGVNFADYRPGFSCTRSLAPVPPSVLVAQL